MTAPIKKKSVSETGYAINVNSFSLLILECISLGLRYNPALALIKVANLKAALIVLQDSMTGVYAAAAPWMKAVNDRESVWKPIDALMVRVKNAVLVCDVTEEFKQRVINMVKIIVGRRVTPKIAMKTVANDPQSPTEETIKKVSASHQSYVMKLDSIMKLLALLAEEPNYDTNEPDLTLAALNALATDLLAKTTAVNENLPDLQNARILRKKVHFKPGNDLAGKVKLYFKSAFGANSDEYHTITKLKFVVY